MPIDFKELKREDCRIVARRLGLELNRQDKVRCFLHAGDKNPSYRYTLMAGSVLVVVSMGTLLTLWPGIGVFLKERPHSGLLTQWGYPSR